MLCLAPVILAGYLFGVNPGPRAFESPGVEVQTCEQGLGLHAKAYGHGTVAFGTQYGLHKAWGPWTLTVQPQAGLAHSDIGYSKKLFELGLQMTVGYEHARFGVEYWHMSNAGTSYPNGGLDMIVLQTGWKF